MKVYNFCCENFEGMIGTSKHNTFNIKVLKSSDKDNIPSRVVISSGIAMGHNSPILMLIRFCPYCGTDLMNLMKSDYYNGSFSDDFYQDQNNNSIDS